MPLTPFFKANDTVQVQRSNGVWLTCRVISIDIPAASALFQPLDIHLQPSGELFDTLFDRVRPQGECIAGMHTSQYVRCVKL